MKRQDEEFTGQFDYEGETIYYKIIDSSAYKIEIRKGIEKFSRQIHFYSNKGIKKGWHLIYDDYDIVTNITPAYALKQYKIAKKKGEIK